MISIPKISKGNNSAKNVGGVTVVNLCTSSDRALHFVKLSRTVSKLWTGHECSTADGPTDGQTDGQTLKSSEGIT